MSAPYNPDGIVLSGFEKELGWRLLDAGEAIKDGDCLFDTAEMKGQRLFKLSADCIGCIVGSDEVKATVARLGGHPSAGATGTDRRRAILQQVESCVCRDRQNSYGDAEDNFTRIAALWNVQFGHKLKEPLSSKDVALAMIHVKCARAITSPGHLDNAVDGAGYFVCLGGIIESEKGKA